MSAAEYEDHLTTRQRTMSMKKDADPQARQGSVSSEQVSVEVKGGTKEQRRASAKKEEAAAAEEEEDRATKGKKGKKEKKEKKEKEPKPEKEKKEKKGGFFSKKKK